VYRRDNEIRRGLARLYRRLDWVGHDSIRSRLWCSYLLSQYRGRC